MGEPRLFMIRMMTTFLWCLPWKERPAKSLQTSSLTTNIYSQFTNLTIWPRGFPLENLHQEETLSCCERSNTSSPVWVRQYLAQHDPDVDHLQTHSATTTQLRY